MLGKTVVNIEVKRLKAQTLPAITVCIPALFSMSKLSELNENNRKLYQYLELVNSTTNSTKEGESLKLCIKKFLKVNLAKELTLVKC